jgi:hypothetical protein
VPRAAGHFFVFLPHLGRRDGPAKPNALRNGTEAPWRRYSEQTGKPPRPHIPRLDLGSAALPPSVRRFPFASRASGSRDSARQELRTLCRRFVIGTGSFRLNPRFPRSGGAAHPWAAPCPVRASPTRNPAHQAELSPLSLHAVTPAPSKGRLMRCTVLGSTPNRAAILRTPSGRHVFATRLGH